MQYDKKSFIARPDPGRIFIRCSNSPDPTQTNEAAKKCETIVKRFNERLLSEANAEKIQGWQLILDNPTCFLSDATEIAKTEISALQNQP